MKMNVTDESLQTKPSLKTHGLLQKLSSRLHVAAAIVLLLFAVSHFAFLCVHNADHHTQNPVFPFITNDATYALAGVFELVVAGFSFVWRGTASANLLILFFVMVIVWYRWAFFYTGGITCNCLGYLGRLLHISKPAERALPIATLIFLTATTFPWLGRIIFRIVSKRLGLFLLLMGLAIHTASGQTLQIQGTIDVGVYNPISGAAYTNTHSFANFSATISNTRWVIAATNMVDHAYWAQLAYDGTNSYVTEPYGSNPWFELRPKDNEVLTSISPGPRYFPRDGDWLGLGVIWLSYCLSPELAERMTTNGITTIPAPWWAPRMSAKAYGFRWIIDFANSQYVHDLKVVRDTNLDLTTNEEILRWELDYPDSVGKRNTFKGDYSLRKQIDSGFVDATYHCTNWLATNGLAIPMDSEFYKWWLDLRNQHVFKYPSYKGFLHVQSVALVQNQVPLLPLPSELTHVRDYRFKRMNQSRVFNYAEYQLNVGDSWKPDNDPGLLAQAEYGLKHGIKINSDTLPTNILAWLILVLICAPIGVIAAMLRKRDKTKTN